MDMDNQVLLRRMAWTVSVLIAAVAVFMTWVLAQPSAYEEHRMEPSTAATWPDGSPRTANDWWAQPSVATSPEQPAPPKPGPGSG
jgi:hypothetical protein